jgi:hypothetical protein
VSSALEARAAFEAGAALRRAPESRLSCLPKRSISLDVGGRTAIEAVEDRERILRTKLVQQLIGADNTRFGAGSFVSDQIGHRLREIPTVGDARRRPHAGQSSRPLLSPPPHDDDEVMLAEDRVAIVAGSPDAEGGAGCWRP